MVLDISTNNETNTDNSDRPLGKEKSDNIFFAVPSSSNTISTAENILASYTTSSSPSSYIDSILPPTSTNKKNLAYGYYPMRRLSETTIDMSDTRHHSSFITSPKMRRAGWSIPKPSAFNLTREREKSDMSLLNDKLADYVEKVRYLESQNKKIQLDANHLSEKDREATQKIKLLFDDEVAQLRELAEKLLKDKNTVFIDAQNAQSSILPLKQCLNQVSKESDSSKYETDKVERQLSSIEGDIIMYNRRLMYQDKELGQWKQWMGHVQRILLQAKNEIHNEHLKRASCEQAVKQLQTDIARVHEQQEQKLNELKHTSYVLSAKSTNDRAGMFKSELSHAIKRVRQDFERQNDLQRNELYKQFTQAYEQTIRQYPEFNTQFLSDHEQDRIHKDEEQTRTEIQRTKTSCELLKQKNSDLKLRVRELEINFDMSEEENKRIIGMLDSQVNQWKLKLDKIEKDYEDVMSKQSSLKKEIGVYRDLLEGTMKPVVESIVSDYNLKTNNGTDEFEQYNSPFNLNAYSALSERSVSPDNFEFKDDNDSFVSFMALNLNNAHSTSTKESSASKSETLLETNPCAESFFLKMHEHPQQIIETTDDIDY